MSTRWLGVVLVVMVALGIIVYKHHRSRYAAALSSPKPGIILVADFSEANSQGDNCAEIIRLVRDTSRRGIKVQELAPESDSPLLKQYHVLTIPTVLVLDHDGKVVSRYEGEDDATVRQIRGQLQSMSKVQR